MYNISVKNSPLMASFDLHINFFIIGHSRFPATVRTSHTNHGAYAKWQENEFHLRTFIPNSDENTDVNAWADMKFHFILFAILSISYNLVQPQLAFFLHSNLPSEKSFCSSQNNVCFCRIIDNFSPIVVRYFVTEASIRICGNSGGTKANWRII